MRRQLALPPLAWVHALLLTLAAATLCHAEAPTTLADQAALMRVTAQKGACNTDTGYAYRVSYRDDGTYQTHDLDGNLVDSGTYNYHADNATVDYITTPAPGVLEQEGWREIFHFQTPTTGTLDGATTAGLTCTYTATFSLTPTPLTAAAPPPPADAALADVAAPPAAAALAGVTASPAEAALLTAAAPLLTAAAAGA